MERSVCDQLQGHKYYHKACLEYLRKSAKSLSQTSRAWNVPLRSSGTASYSVDPGFKSQSGDRLS
jgi:hypothetical protein